MGGPAAGVLLRQEVTGELRARVRADIAHSEWLDDDGTFLLHGRTFGLVLEAVDEELRVGVLRAVGQHWSPRASIGFWAACNREPDHRLLGELCAMFASRFDGIIDFGGALLPPIERERETLFDSWLHGECRFDAWREHVQAMTAGLPGRLFESPYVTANGGLWISHLCDSEFIEAWLRHPHFHMVK